MDRKWIVYVHIFPNGKRYIGVTAQTVNKRWRNGNGYKDQPILWGAIVKYGWKNIKHEILLENLTQEEALKKEQELIKEYKTFPPSLHYGYNATSGGQRPPQWNEKQRRQISERQKGEKSPMWGKHLPEETRRKISKSSIGRKAWNTGIKMSEEYCAKLSQIRKGRIVSPETVEKIKLKSMKKVICVETGIVYDSQRVAAQTLGLNEAHISECIKGNGRRNICGGFHWKRYTDFPEVTEVSMDEFLKNQGENT